MAESGAAGRWRQWDAVTAGVVMARLGPPPPIRYFTPDEQATATALCDRLLDLGPDTSVPVVAMIDSRLAESETDGWHYADMPEDGRAWSVSLAGLKADAVDRFQRPFAELEPASQDSLIGAVQALGSDSWHGLPAGHVWSLWTRYACTAFYGHPFAWDEIGFPGPAYPRGYKNLGIGRGPQ
ncbi:MAG TPA: gluconate 2-dehydrogenase subunit 3 family protein [Actinospica sp.]|nr:gluconate 2-dehydrogenase subunit 3 family protein [Actinospica sp.]